MKVALVAVLALVVYGCQSQAPSPDPRIAQLENQVSTLKAQNANLQQQNVDAASQRDTCTAKFNRVTFLYDVGFLNNETRVWAIPADVDPVLVTGKTGTYSHYDPKTQTETVHFKGKTAQ